MEKLTKEEFKKLLELYKQARQKIAAEMVTYNGTNASTAALLVQVNKQIKELEEKTGAFLDKSIPREYKAEIKRAETKITIQKRKIKKDHFNSYTISSLAQNSFFNKPTGKFDKPDRFSGKGYSYEEVLTGLTASGKSTAGRIVLDHNAKGQIILVDGRHLLEAYRDKGLDIPKEVISTNNKSILKQIKGPINLGGGLTVIDEAAIEYNISDMKERLLINVRGVKNSAVNYINQYKQQKIRDALAIGTITGESGPTLARQLAADMRKEGITGFINKRGARLKLDTYMFQLVRNNIQIVHNQAAQNRYVQAGIKVVRYSTIADAKVSNICRPREGQYYRVESITPPPIGSHFNCRHNLIPVVRVPAGVTVYNGYQN